jgi:hypothetical protein
MALIYFPYVIVIFYWQLNNVKAGKCRRSKAIVLHAILTTLPVILYAAVFILLIGVEKFTDIAIIGEGYARTLLFVIAVGVAIAFLATFIFSLLVFVMKLGNNNTT